MAAQYDHPESIDVLHAAGANLNAPCSIRVTPAHLAAEYGHTGAIRALRRAGANLNAADADGRTPMQVAAAAGHAEAIFALHAANAGLSEASGAEGLSPDELAAFHYPQDVKDALLSYRERPLMEAAVSALGDSADRAHRNLAAELTCPVMLTPYTTRGDTRPVRLPDGVDATTRPPVPGSVISAIAALQCMRPDVNHEYGRPPPTDPLNRNPFTEEAADAFLASEGFRQGDPDRVALVGAVWAACRKTDRSPSALTAEAAAAAAATQAITAARPAASAVPQYQAILDAHAARDASSTPSGAADRRHVQGGPTS